MRSDRSVASERQEEEDGLRMTDANIKNRSPASIPSAAAAASKDADDPEQALGTGTRARKQRARDAYTMSEDDQILEIKSACFYRPSFLKDIIFALFCLITGGLAVIVCLAYPSVYARLRFIQVKQNDDEAEFVLVESLDGIFSLAQIQWIFKKGDEEGWMPCSKSHFLPHELKSRDRMFVWREERFWYNDGDGSWNRRTFNLDLPYAELHTIAHVTAVKEVGPDSTGKHKSGSRSTRFLAYGSNQLRVELPNVGRLLMTEVFKPFFVFQVFSIAVWMYQDYTVYAYVILSMTVVAVLFNVMETRSNLQAIRKLAASECEVRLLTLKAAETDSGAGEIEFKSDLVSSSELLPGDIVEIEAGMVFPCDLLLLAGQCVVNESMLTGESASVPKTPLPVGPSASGQVFNDISERDERHMLMSGTKAIQIRGSTNPRLHRASDSEDSDQHPSIWEFLGATSTQTNHSTIKETSSVVAAMVIRTAYGTTKGKLVRAIRFPKPSKYNFEKKLYYFVVNCGVYLILVCALTIYFQAGKVSAFDIFLNCLNLTTIAVPAALPLALSVGISVSFKRLQKNGVYCINSGRIVGAGRVDTLCFDKTGTITEDGLNLRGVVPVIENEEQSSYKKMSYGRLQEDPHAVYLQGQQALVSLQAGNSPDKTSLSSLGLFYTLAACHSISVLDHIIETGCGMAKENSIWNQMRKPGLWLQRFREVFEALTCNHFHAKYSENGSEPDERNRCHFIGDPLEIKMFTSTGWRYISRPFEERFWSVDGTNPPTVWTDVLRIADTVIMGPGEGASEPPLAILRRFDFDSEIRLMSSIVLELLPGRDSNTEFVRSWLLVKGAPESLQDICVPESLPEDYTSQLHDFSHKGYRVLACAYRALGSMTIPLMMAAKRQEMEKELTYCGFLIMENKLKPETSGVLLQLAEAGLRQVMVTGDNPFTAAAVARQSGPFFLEPSRQTYLLDRASEFSPDRYKSGCVMKSTDFTEENIDVDALLQPQANVSENRPHLSWNQRSSNIGSDINLIVTGRAFAALTVQHDQLREQDMERTGASDVKVTECVTPLQMVLTEANIFARMSPQHKAELMRSLQDLGYVVCMTGDGANDSGALKAADVGISISSKPVDSTDSVEAGPSIAAPFSTKLAHIGAVPMVLAEGRCALVTATVMFKYMFFYALIQATAVLVLYRLQLELYDYQYLWADLGIVLPIVLVMPATRPRKKLSRGKPIDNLLAPAILISVYGHSVVIILFQVSAQLYLENQSWYTKPDGEDPQHNVNTTVSFLFSSFQYVGLAMALSQSFGTFRKSPFTNILLSVTLTCHLVLSSLFLLKPMQFAFDAFSLVDISVHKYFVFGLWMLAIGNILLSILFERYAVSQKSSELDMSDSPHNGPEGDNIDQTCFGLRTMIR